MGGMPELPEVEITARLLDGALRGARIESALAPGINALKTFDPPLAALGGRDDRGRAPAGQEPDRRASVPGAAPELVLLIHLMSAGRLQLYDKRAGPRDRTSRLLVRVRAPGGTASQSGAGAGAAPARVRLQAGRLGQAAARRRARRRTRRWPSSAPRRGPTRRRSRRVLDAPRPLHALLRDQRTIAGIGRSWVDEILWQARLSPYKRGADLDAAERERLREAMIETLGGAIAHYEQAIQLPIPDKLPMPLRVHRHEGEPCPRCGATLQAVHFEDYVIAYCPACQTDGRVLKDRRLSRLLK